MPKSYKTTKRVVGETDRHYAPEIKAVDIVYGQLTKWATGRDLTFRVTFTPNDEQLVKILEILADV